MRIVAGKFRSRHLKPVKGLDLRPTSDRLRETLFNILGPHVESSRFMDLFAGTGAVGIEAVSRGAEMVVFVEKHVRTSKLIRENLEALAIRGGVRIVALEAISAIAKLEKENSPAFDFIFLDPPYSDHDVYKATLGALENSLLVDESTAIIVEHQKKFQLPSALGSLERVRVVSHGDAVLSFFKTTTVVKSD